MSNAYVIEWRAVAIENNVMAPVPRGLPLRVQRVTVSDSESAATPNAIGNDCHLVEIWTDHTAHFSGGVDPTATTDDLVVSAGMSKWFHPAKGQSTKFAFLESAFNPTGFAQSPEGPGAITSWSVEAGGEDGEIDITFTTLGAAGDSVTFGDGLGTITDLEYRIAGGDWFPLFSTATTTYTVAADVSLWGQTVTVSVRAIGSSGRPGVISSDTVAVPGGSGDVPVFASAPFIIGTGETGELHEVGGIAVSGSPAPTLSYEWKIGGVTVWTGATYTPTIADALGKDNAFSSGFSSGFGGSPSLSVTVTATNASGQASSTSSALDVEIVGGQIFAAAIDGSGYTGDTFTVSYDDSELTGAASVSFKWFLDSVEIVGATGSSYVATDAGALTCEVTATFSAGEDSVVITQPVTVFHQALGGVGLATGTTTLSTTFDLPTSVISNQVYVVLVAYQGPAPTSVEAAGVILSSFTNGADAISGGITVTCLDSEVSDTDKRAYAFAVEGVAGTSFDFEFTTGTNFTFLKAHCYQISSYSIENPVLTHSTGSGATLAVAAVKPSGALLLALANRMPALSTTPTGWVTGQASDVATAGLDYISGYIASLTTFIDNITFAQTDAGAGEQAVALVLLPGTPTTPDLVEDPTITGGTAPVEGTPFTLNIAAASSVTTSVHVQVYRVSGATLTPVGSTVDYEIGSGDPAPTYTPTAADVGFTLILGETPFLDSQAGIERFSTPTGVVTAATPEETDPDQLSEAMFTFVGADPADGGITTDGNGVQIQRADFTILAGVTIPSGWEIGLLRSLSPGITVASGHPELQNVQTLANLGLSYTGALEQTWRSNGGAADGVSQYGYAFWIETATGRMLDAVATDPEFNAQYTFVSEAPTGEEPPVNPPPGGAANQTLTTATSSAVIAAINARIASGSAADWIIDLPSGNYSALNLTGKVLPGRTTLRSANQNLGAKFPHVDLTRAKNITLQLLDIDRTIGGGATSIAVDLNGATFCAVDYCRVHVGPIIKSANKPGYDMNCQYGIHINNTAGPTPANLRIHMNLLSGPCHKQIYGGAFDTVEISDNIGINAGVDFIHIGWGNRASILRNWAPRAYWTHYDAEANPPRWGHNDFIQHNGRTSFDWIVRGNVLMGQRNGLTSTGMPVQGLFANLSTIDGWLFEDNIICSNHTNGIHYKTETRNLTLRRNTLLRTIDQQPFAETKVRFLLDGPGPNSLSDNVQASSAGDTSMGGNGINIVVSKGGVLDGTPQLAFYVAPYKDSTFYELRPVAGAVTHWDYTGVKKGAYQRFRDVILGGQYPKYGPAGTAWQTEFNWKGQIQ